MSTPCGRQYGDQAKVICEAGYELSGQNITCQSNGTWYIPHQVCIEVDCGVTEAPIFGTVDYSLGTVYTSVVEYICDSGYDLIGPMFRKCQANKTWSNHTPECVPVNCGPPETADGGSVHTPNGTTFGNIAIYSCPLGTFLVGNETSMCSADITWESSAPTCYPVDCGNLTSPDFGTVDTSNGTLYKNIATYTCFSGYTLNGVISRTCNESGLWSYSEAVCEAVNCSEPFAPGNGTVSLPNGTTYRNSAHYKCSYGFYLSGINVTVCQSDGSWSGQTPNCSFIDCGYPELPLNVYAYTPYGTTFEKILVYNCSVGYEMLGPNTGTCLYNSSWSNLDPNCVILDCGSLEVIKYGNIHYPFGTTYGAEAQISCDSGFAINGTNNLFCGANGNWAGVPPTCILIGLYISNSVE